ncbi:MAG: antibiotic biosynthesis monooxygenase [Aestuariivirga sp.]
MFGRSGKAEVVMAETDKSFELAVTVVVRRRVREGASVRYEEWLKRLIAEAAALPGYMGADIHRPASGSREFVSIFRFDNPENLAAFEGSELRRKYLAEIAPYVEGDAAWDRYTGLEFWFAPPPGTRIPQPSPFRMALLLVAVVYLLVLSIGSVMGYLLASWPHPLRLFVTIVIEVFAMTYVVMPRLTRRLARWIYIN